MQETIDRLSRELHLPPEVIKRTYKAYWYYIKHSIESLPLKEKLSEEEFNKIKANFNIPNLGKLACPYKRYIGIHKQMKYLSKNVKHT